MSIISLILTIILIIALIIFISQIILNKKLIRAKDSVDFLNGKFEIQYTPKGEVIYYMKLPLSEDLKNETADFSALLNPVIPETISECNDEPDLHILSDLQNVSDLQNEIKIKIDPDFLDRVTSLIYREITNTDNIIEVISAELCISSSHLNRKIKSMTGMTTSKFILKTRLSRAKKQLTVTQKQIGDVAMDCGFNDFAYFSRSFKKEFDMTPSTFQRLIHSVN